MAILTTQKLRKHYGAEPNLARALDGVDLEIEAREFVAVVGMFGSGKSTLLHMLGGLDKPTDGKVIVDGHELSQMTDEQLTIFRRRNVGFVFQSYNLVPILSVYENIDYQLSLTAIQWTRLTSMRLSALWDLAKSGTPCRISFPVVSSNVWRLPALWQQNRQ